MTDYENMLLALKQAGYRLTPQRIEICKTLADSHEHPSAQMIYDQVRLKVSHLSLATIYNTLEALTHLGVINVLGEVGDNNAVRYDAGTEPHVNLACIRCQSIRDIPSRSVEELAAEVKAYSGYTLLSARVLYYGICPVCQAQQSQV
jgi:Fur family transcriptional regulator, peroxide stress response regulator